MLFINYSRKNKICIMFIYSSAVFLCATAHAQDNDGQKDKPSIEINSYARYMPSSKVNATSGGIAITKLESEYIYEFKAGGKLPVTFSLSSEYIGINNTTEISMPSKLTGLNADLETTLPFFKFKNTYLRSGLNPSFYTEDWNIRASSFRIPLRSFLIYQPSCKWTFIAGIALYPKFRQTAWPIIGFIYKPNDKLTYNIVPKNPNINYRLNERTDLFTEAGLSIQEFEVNKDGIKNRIFEYNETRLAAGIKYKLNRSIQSGIAFGGVFNRSLKYTDDSVKAVIKDGIYTEFKIDITI